MDYLEHVSNAGAGVVRSGCSNQTEHVLKDTRPARQVKGLHHSERGKEEDRDSNL